MVYYTLYKSTWGGKGDKEYSKKYTSPAEARVGAVNIFMKDVATSYVQIYAYTKEGSDLYGVITDGIGGYYFQTITWGKGNSLNVVQGKKRLIQRDGSLKK